MCQSRNRHSPGGKNEDSERAIEARTSNVVIPKCRGNAFVIVPHPKYHCGLVIADAGSPLTDILGKQPKLLMRIINPHKR
jgi:hypothetical protein